MRQFPILRTVAASALSCLAATSALAQVAADPWSAARPLTATEVRRLYAGKTWSWPDGAGHFDENRDFRAWVGSGPSATVARGRWLVTNNGRMCFEAQWRYRGGVDPQRTCFRHRRLGEAIQQQREPDGAWIAFLSEPPAAGDEIEKLRDGDQVSERLPALEREIAGPRPAPQNRRP